MIGTKKSKARSATRHALLQAASQVVLDKSVEALTLDAVAQQAGVSKGGLLYHFPNKDALIAGLIEQLVLDFETILQEEFDRDADPGTPGQWVRAYVRATLRSHQQSLALVASLSTVVATNPELLQPVQAYEQRWRQKLETSGIDPVRATIIQLAIDGLWFAETFRLGTLDEPLRTQVVDALLAMAQEHD
ncbi:TetR family transcriptional regulator [Scytonema sp. UIC 10036]|uniref:TetR/AcrR family transcriptional regulator n=1 Tax=Scytonema sp. UIC 10036 TaxID=2304196 RepID=UPI00140FA296|nr:TetR family transcriptional regulator [Scytonema sp. UIC 10036]